MRVDNQGSYNFGFWGRQQQQFQEATVRREYDRQGMFGFGRFGWGKSHLVIDAGKGDDVISVKKTGENEYTVDVNGQKFILNKEEMKNLVIKGGAGNDHIFIDPSVDMPITVDGGDGSDVIFNFAKNARIYGGRGQDVVINYADNVFVDSGADADFILSNGNNCDIRGGFGADMLRVYGDKNHVYGGTGTFWDLYRFGGQNAVPDDVKVQGNNNKQK